MDDIFKIFVDTLYESENSRKTAMRMRKISEYDYTNCTAADVEQFILDMNPKDVREITYICTFMCSYAEFIEDDNMYSIVSDIDRNKIWEKAKPTSQKKYISHSEFNEVCENINKYEEFNVLYQRLIFRCIYEGIYNEDLSVLRNLKASDVHGNVVTLRESSGNTYDLEISKELAEDLKEMGSVNVWERKNGKGICRIHINGEYQDSCFKIESRSNRIEDTCYHTYYRILRKIYNEYLGYKLMPSQLYISGIMHRIIQKLKEQNISTEDAFSLGNKDRNISSIISSELERCNYTNGNSAFRELVACRLDDFDK